MCSLGVRPELVLVYNRIRGFSFSLQLLRPLSLVPLVREMEWGWGKLDVFRAGASLKSGVFGAGSGGKKSVLKEYIFDGLILQLINLVLLLVWKKE